MQNTPEKFPKKSNKVTDNNNKKLVNPDKNLENPPKKTIDVSSAYEPVARPSGGLLTCQKENPDTAELNAILAKIEAV